MPLQVTMPPSCWLLTDWTFTETPPEPGEVMPYMNILARKNFRLVNPEDPNQVLYCTCDRRRVTNRRGVDGLRWERRYGCTQQANAALLAAWEPRDGWTDAAGTALDLLATIVRVFRQASDRKKMDLQKMDLQKMDLQKMDLQKENLQCPTLFLVK